MLAAISHHYYSNALLSLIEYKIAITTSLTNTKIFTHKGTDNSVRRYVPAIACPKEVKNYYLVVSNRVDGVLTV
jgi:hypothetical protein